MFGLDSLAHLFMNAAGAGKFAAPGGQPNFGDALQGIGHSMKQHYLGTPENIPTVVGGTNPTGLLPAPVAKAGPSLADIAALFGHPQAQAPAPTPAVAAGPDPGLAMLAAMMAKHSAAAAPQFSGTWGAGR